MAKANAYMGKRKVKDQWEEKLYEMEHQVAEWIPSFLMKNQQTGCSWVLHQNWLFSHHSDKGDSSLYGHARKTKWAGCTTTTLEEQTLERNETEEAPQSANCPPPAQHQTDETPLGWMNRKFSAFLQTFSGASLLDQG